MRSPKILHQRSVVNFLVFDIVSSFYSCYINADTVIGVLQMCIVSMSKEDVRAWLQLKCDDEESQFFKSMRSPRGEILATRTRDRFKSDIGDDGIAEDIFTQVTINLETYGSDTITPKMFAAVMKTRGDHPLLYPITLLYTDTSTYTLARRCSYPV